VGFAFDLPGTIVVDSSFTPTSYAGFACGVAGSGPGQILFGNFAAEAQAGDGTEPDPTPSWIVSAGLLSRLGSAAHATAAHFFNTPRTFVTGASSASLALLGMGSAVPTMSFADETKLAAAVTAGRLRAGAGAIVYAAGATRATPPAQQRNPAHYYALAADVAHQRGLLFIAAPQTSLVKTLAPLTPAGGRDAEFLRLGLARDTARHADAFEAPAPASQGDASAFASFVEAASRQAARSHPGIELLAGLNAGAPRSAPSPDSLFDAFLSTRLTVAGYGISGPAATATTAGVAFLHKLERLDG
jgi:hypothetical protein